MGTDSKALMAVLEKMGIHVKSHMGALTEDDVQAVLKKGGLGQAKGAQKKGKAQKSGATAAAPKKKRFVLIKKKTAPTETESPELDIPPDGIEAEESTTAPAPEIVAPSLEAPLAVSLDHTETEAPVAASSPPEEETVIAAAIEAEAPSLAAPMDDEVGLVESEAVASPPVNETTVEVEDGETQKKKEKKKGKSEPRESLKKELASKAKEKTKKGRRGEWDPTAGAQTLEGSAEARKWQDFKPIHKKDERRSSRKGHGRPVVDAAKPRKKSIKIQEGITVKEFSELIGQKVTTIIGKLMELGKMSTLNEAIGLDEAALIAESFDVKAELISEKTEDEILMQNEPEDPTARVARPPVITIMGHVDHGKTSLLDAIRETKVTEGEAGGITQHIGAYMVTVGDKKITFLDTPGHEAFTAMRARGANVTDIVILVVAADDGVMPQTIEAINHAKSAKVPIVVAINKIDKPGANPERIKQALTEYQLVPEEWGGETIFLEVSAKAKTGLEALLEMILLQSDVLELKANPEKPMTGVIIEAKIERGRGPVATVLVREGTLKVGSAFVTGSHYGKVRSMINDKGKRVKEAGPSMPVEVIGLDGVPLAGDTFITVADDRVAKEVATSRTQNKRDAKLSQIRRVTLDDLYQEIQDGSAHELNVIIKSDVQGSSEALSSSLEKLSTPSVKLQVIHASVGSVTESDILLAAASNAIVIGFNIRPESKARELAEKEKVDIRLYSIIYEAIADVRSAMEGLLEPTLKERVLGRIEVREIFTVPKQGTIAGSYVTEGMVSRNCSGVRVLRDNGVLYDGKLSSLRRFKDDVKEVQTGYECGIGIENFNDIQVGDVLEPYVFDKIPAKLESV